MYRTIEEIIASSKDKESDEIAVLQAHNGDLCDALRGFIDISAEWKVAADKAFSIDFDNARMSPFTARALTLSLLTTKILDAAYEVPKTFLSGALAATLVNWRYMVETRNIALMIDLDVLGTTGFHWLHHGMIEMARVGAAGKDSRKFFEQAKEILFTGGFAYDARAKDPWSIGIDGKKYSNSVDRSKYIWEQRKFPLEVTEKDRVYFAAAEQQMLRETGNLLHPSLTPREVIAGKLPAMVMSTILDPMAVMLAYKVAASELVEWPETKTVGEQFHVYPADEEAAESLSFMVKDMYDYCGSFSRQHFLGERSEAVDNPGLDSQQCDL